MKKITKEKPTPSTPDNEYMKMCRAKRSRNNEYLAKVLEDIKKKGKSPSCTPTNSPKTSKSKGRDRGSITPPSRNTAKKRYCLRIKQESLLSPRNVHIMTSLHLMKKLTGDILLRGGIYMVRNV